MDRNKFAGRAIIVIIVFMVWTIILLMVWSFLLDDYQGDSPVNMQGAKYAEGRRLPVTIQIDCVGDIMMHQPQLTNMYDTSGQVDLAEYFSYTKPIISAADIALCNIETTFDGEPYSGYPLFSSPDDLAACIKDAGFDVGITSNNHMLDRGAAGLKRTIETASNAGLIVSGSRLDTEEKKYIIMDVRGIKVGVVSYTSETGDADGDRGLNGVYLSDESKSLINSYNPKDSSDTAAITNSIAGAKADGAQIIICYFHWGNEYERRPNEEQRHIAQVAVDSGADVIFASHPHVLQPMEMLYRGIQAVPVYWSMGNYISNQREETLQNRYTEQGIIAQVDFTYDSEQSRLISVEASYTPLWVDRYEANGRTNYAAIPLSPGFEEFPFIVTSGHKQRAEAAKGDIYAILGGRQEWNLETKNVIASVTLKGTGAKQSKKTL